MTVLEKLITEIDRELKDREGCNGALNSGVVLGLTNAKNIALQFLEIEKNKHQETWDSAHQAGRFEGKGIAEENWQTFETYWEETYK